MDLLKEVCSLPTAPFMEDRVVRYVEQFVKARRRLRLSRDRAGNLLVELPSRRRRPRWVFTAHMDHPGFVAGPMAGRRMLEADFRGYVLAEYVKGAAVRFFLPDGTEATGTVVSVQRDTDSLRARSARIRVDGEVPPGVPGMFDLGEGRTKGGTFHCRAVDDLGGLAAVLAMLDRLHADPPAAPVAALFTRAEEDGFIGAMAAVRSPKLLREDDRLIAIECSAMQPYAPQGAGPILRVGDRTSIFNSGLTYFLAEQAEALAKSDKKFRYQRALMPGGTCEATVYDVYGFMAGSICIALGNYHNMDRDRRRMGPEYIDVKDWRDMVKLFEQVARHGHEYEPGHKALRKRLEERFRLRKPLL